MNSCRGSSNKVALAVLPPEQMHTRSCALKGPSEGSHEAALADCSLERVLALQDLTSMGDTSEEVEYPQVRRPRRRPSRHRPDCNLLNTRYHIRVQPHEMYPRRATY